MKPIQQRRAINTRWSRATTPDTPLSAEQASTRDPSSRVSFNPGFYASGPGITRPVKGAKPARPNPEAAAELAPKAPAKITLSIPPWEQKKATP